MKVYREITPLTEHDTFISKDCQNAHFDYPLHNHKEFELTLIMKCSGTRIVGDSITKYQDCDLVLVGPEVYHRWDDSDLPEEDKKITPHVIVTQFEENLFDPSLLAKKEFYPIKTLLEDAVRGLVFHGETFNRVKKKLLGLKDLSGFEAVIEFFQVLNLLAVSSEKQYLASEGYSSRPQHSKSKRINDVYNYILANFTKKINLAEAASIANMSESAFSHFFKKSTHKSFTQFVIDLRIGHACKLLLETQDTISQICYQCGFNNVSNFNRLFKKYKDFTPYDYRKQFEKNKPFSTRQYQPVF